MGHVRHVRNLIAVLLAVLSGPALALQGSPVYTAIPTYPVVGGACLTGRVQIRQDTGDPVCCVATQWVACGAAVPNSGISTVPISAPSFTSTAASGATGYSQATGVKLDFGGGTSDHAVSNGTTVTFAGPVAAEGVLSTSSSMVASANVYHGTGGAFVGNGVAAAIRGTVADGATAVAVKIGSNTTLTTTGAKILKVCADTPGTCAVERASIDKDGLVSASAGYTTGGYVSATTRVIWSTSPTLPACGTAVGEGTSVRQAGGTSGARTRLCLCTSDGGGTPAYAWVSVPGGTVGDATTCSP